MAYKTKQKFEFFTLATISKLALNFWIGGILTIAIVVTPLLFKNLDQISAANLASQIFNLSACIGMVSLILGLLHLLIENRLNSLKLRRFWYLLVLCATLIINYFAIFPVIAKLRHHLTDLTKHVVFSHSEFGFWHSLSATLFIFSCIIGVLYLVESNQE